MNEVRSQVENEVGGWEGKAVPLGFRVTSRELELLEFVLDQKFASSALLYFRFYQGKDSSSARYAHERLSLLCRHGLLESKRVFTERENYYLATPPTQGLLQGHRPDLRIQEPADSIDIRQFEHDKRVGWCRASREKAGLACDWRSERRLKQEFAARSNYSFAREWMPDAIYQSRQGGRVAFELELSPKTPERYAKKISKLTEVMGESRAPFERVLYVSCSEPVHRVLTQLTRPYGERFKVARYLEIVPIQIAQHQTTPSKGSK